MSRSPYQHLRDLVLIIEQLYPQTYTVNKFETMLYHYSREHLTRRQKELLYGTIKAITLLHKSKREKDIYDRFYSTKEDIELALNLILRELPLSNRTALLDPFQRRIISYLDYEFGEGLFTARELSKGLRIGKTTAFRQLYSLSEVGLIEKTTEEGKHGAFTWRLIHQKTRK